MLQSATLIKTLCSCNIDLSDLSSSAGTKRNRTLSPTPGKKQRLEKQRPKSVNISSDYFKSHLRPGVESKLLFEREDSGKRDFQEISYSKKVLKDKKHKSISPGMWQENEEVVEKSQSDSEMTPVLSSISRRLNFIYIYHLDCEYSLSSILIHPVLKCWSSKWVERESEVSAGIFVFPVKCLALEGISNIKHFMGSGDILADTLLLCSNHLLDQLLGMFEEVKF